MPDPRKLADALASLLEEHGEQQFKAAVKAARAVNRPMMAKAHNPATRPTCAQPAGRASQNTPAPHAAATSSAERKPSVACAWASVWP